MHFVPLLIFLLNILLAVPMHGQELILAPDTAAGDFFGVAVSLSASGEMMVVGSPQDDVSGMIDAGSAHVFSRAGDGAWIYQQKLLAPDVSASGAFGNSVAISPSGDTIIVGYANDVRGTGSAHIFSRLPNGSWERQQKLLAPDGAEGDGFGGSVSLSSSGDTAVVGARPTMSPVLAQPVRRTSLPARPAEAGRTSNSSLLPHPRSTHG
ncbi:MAG: FG-GAP repeat protein [Deltaproteobacteria bacterium]|nr:FG-GAP repeat protein [Deltaproteobacteria bacterium]